MIAGCRDCGGEGWANCEACNGVGHVYPDQGACSWCNGAGCYECRHKVEMVMKPEQITFIDVGTFPEDDPPVRAQPKRRTMLLDPPWLERGAGKSKRGADAHYPLMSTQDILETVVGSGLWTPDRQRCSVWMWATANFLKDALWLMDKLGAQYVTNVVWAKANQHRGEDEEVAFVTAEGDPEDPITTLTFIDAVVPQQPGLGQRVRMCHEHLLYGRVGSVPVPEPENRLPSVIYAPRTKHSKKPVEAYELIERHDGPGARLEFFAREQREGWDVFGDEV